MTPSLRARPEFGEPYDDPSEDLLFILLQDIETGAGTYVIVERTADPTDQTSIQTQRQPDGSHLVEHREGDATTHVGTTVADMRAAHELLTGGAFELPGWADRAAWTPVVI